MTENRTNNPSVSDATVRLGFIPLIDCAPFIIAQEKGFFNEEGVRVSLSKEASWASIRDKVAFNILDGAHMLASLPIAASLGIGTVKSAMETSFTVSHNGNAITLSKKLFDELSGYCRQPSDITDGMALKRYITERDTSLPVLRFAMVYPYSSHNYQLRSWLSNAGIDPDKDVQIIVIPPMQMIDYLQQGEIDGYCVGEPWNSLAVEQGVGVTVVTSYDLWGSTPEKVFGVNSNWARQNQPQYLGLIRALNKACQWVDRIENQNELLRILSSPDYLNRSVEQLIYGFSPNKPDGQMPWPKQANQRFFGKNINKPLPSYALWIMAQMNRWQQLANVRSPNEFVNQVFREDLYLQALELNQTVEQNWQLSPEQEKTWLSAAQNGQLALAPGGILNGLVFKN